jgi:ribosomal-protein-alanine N-acetyltransferase
MIFETTRLQVRVFIPEDSDSFFDMMGNSNVMNPIPQKVKTRAESDAILEKFTPPQAEDLDKQVYAIIEKKSNHFIGLCAYLKNNENDHEIGYRLREKFWKLGYGTEIAKGLIDNGFSNMGFTKITADVNTVNLNSVKILSKFMTPVKEFFNKRDDCIDRRYSLNKEDWKIK